MNENTLFRCRGSFSLQQSTPTLKLGQRVFLLEAVEA